MDFISHGLWGSIAFGRKSRSSFGLAFTIGMAPDLCSFGVLYVAAALGLSPSPDFSRGTPPESTIPPYVHQLYNYTHSFVIFLAVFFLVWLFLKRPVWELGAWGLHVLAHVPLHSYAFSPPRCCGPYRTGNSTAGNGRHRVFSCPTSCCLGWIVPPSRRSTLQTGLGRPDLGPARPRMATTSCDSSTGRPCSRLRRSISTTRRRSSTGCVETTARRRGSRATARC